MSVRIRTDLSDEPVAATVGRFDEARRLGIVRKRLANLTDRDLQHGIADERVLPDRADQSLFRDKLSRPATAGVRAPRTPWA